MSMEKLLFSGNGKSLQSKQTVLVRVLWRIRTKILYTHTHTHTHAKSLQSCLTLCDPIDGSPPRLLSPWDSPGKNTGVGCHFLLQCMKGKSESDVAQSSPTLSDPMDCSPPGSCIHGIFQAKVLEWGAIAYSAHTHIHTYKNVYMGFLNGIRGKEPVCQCETDTGLIPGSGRLPGGGHSKPLQYSCLENPKHRGVWWAMVKQSQRVRHN